MNLQKQLNRIETDIDELKGLLKTQARTNQKKEILTAKETMDMLKINRSTFDKWRSYGFLKCYKLNRRIFLKYSEILEALENGIIEPKNQ